MTEYVVNFFDHVSEIMEKILRTQAPKIESAGELMADVFINGGNIFAFGPGHAGMFTEEMFYRAGGLVITNPLFHSGVNCEARPISLTTEHEVLPGYATIVLNNSPVKTGDCLIIHSVAARNPVVVEMAIKAKEKGIHVIGIINMQYAAQVTSRDPSGKMLQDVSEIVIDTCGDYGDACLEMAGIETKVAPTSSILGSLLANSLTIQLCASLLKRGIVPPVYQSANMDGVKEYNQKLLNEYKDRIFYV